MKYTRNITTKLRNDGFELIEQKDGFERLENELLIVDVLHFNRSVQFTFKAAKARRIELTERELKFLNKIFAKTI